MIPTTPDGHREGGGSPVPLYVVAAAMILAALLTACTATIEADNTPFGRVRYGATQEAPPPIYSRSTRSTTTKPSPPAPEVTEDSCESGVCGVPGR